MLPSGSDARRDDDPQRWIKTLPFHEVGHYAGRNARQQQQSFYGGIVLLSFDERKATFTASAKAERLTHCLTPLPQPSTPT